MIHVRNRISNLKLILCLIIAFMVVVAFTPESTYAATVKPSKVVITKASSYSHNTVKITWKKAKNAKKYQVYRATSKNGKYKLIKTTTSTSLKNTKLTTGKKYYYKVRAVNGKKKGSFSSVKSVTPKLTTPTVKASSTSSSVKLTWNKISGAKGYQVYYKTSSNGSYKKIKTTKNLSCTKSNLKSAKKYYFKVRAYKTVNGKTKYSEFKYKTATTKKASSSGSSSSGGGSASGGSSSSSGNEIVTPPAAVKLTGEVSLANEIELTWSASSGAEKYIIYRSKAGGSYSKLTSTTARSYADKSAAEGISYSYKVKAYKQGKYSEYSNAVTLKKAKIEVSQPEELQEPYELITGAESDWEEIPISKADGIPEHKDCYLDYDGDNDGDSERIYIGQRWTSSLNKALNGQTGGSGAINYTAERNNRYFILTADDGVTRKLKTYVYCFGTVDYDNFLLLYITGGKISGWKTNADVAGVWKNTVTIRNGEPAVNYDLGGDWGLQVSTLAEKMNNDPNYAVGDVVTAGIDYAGFGEAITTKSFRQEETVAEHYINALRATRGVYPLKHNETLYDPTANETTGYGTKAYAITAAMSKAISHSKGLTKGPLANTDGNDRIMVIADATNEELVMFLENVSGGYDTMVGENVVWGWYTSGGHKAALLNSATLNGYGNISEMAVAGYRYDGFIVYIYQGAFLKD